MLAQRCFTRGFRSAIYVQWRDWVVDFIWTLTPAIEDVVGADEKYASSDGLGRPSDILNARAVYRESQFGVAFATVHVSVSGRENDPVGPDPEYQLLHLSQMANIGFGRASWD